MREVRAAPGSSYFPSWGPAEVRRVTERELVSLSMLRAPRTLIGWPESALSLAASCWVIGQRGQRTPSCRLWAQASIYSSAHTTRYFNTGTITIPSQQQQANLCVPLNGSEFT